MLTWTFLGGHFSCHLFVLYAVAEVKSVEVVYLFFLNRGTVSSAVLGSGSGLMSVH